MKFKEELLAEKITGHRLIAGTEFPIVDQIKRIQIGNRKPFWLIIHSLCNGVPDGVTEYELKRDAFADFAD